MICPDCEAELQLIVDGRWMSEEQLLHLPRAPRKIQRVMSHKLWCTSDDNRMQLQIHQSKIQAARKGKRDIKTT